MSSFTEMLSDPDEVERISKYAFDENPNIKNLPEFQEALGRAFGTSQGQPILNLMNGDEIKTLFESRYVQSKVEINGGETDDTRYESQRKVAKGEKTKPTDIIIVKLPPSFKSRTSTGHVYQRSYTAWNNPDLKFLQVRKQRGDAPKKIIYEYNQHFKQNQRSSSSIRTKLYRL